MPSNLSQEGKSNAKEASGNVSSGSGGQPSIPTISLPKGGGAIRGIGEKFAANPVTGTGSLTVPIAVTPGRSGFSPQLTLSYDSGSGNGPFGLGWNLSLPAITRKTDKGLPKYQDSAESDVFILSGSEDLVPLLNRNGDDWQPDVSQRTVGGVDYQIKRYRPRIEGLFARIERWTNRQTDEKHWRSISKDNITTFYGRTRESRIADPDDPQRVFTWLICESRDDKGNAIVYEYKPEDSSKIDVTQAHESNRSIQSRSANRYLKRIKYGNRTSHLIQPDLSQTGWLFETVFDYDDGHYEQPPTPEDAPQFVNARISATHEWSVRSDPFSTFRAGFEVRTYRMCRRVLMFHHFPEELGTHDYLVRSTEFIYKESPIASFITSVTQSGYVRQTSGTYLKKSLPPLEFEYSEAVVQNEVHEIDAESLENLPYGLDGTRYKWADLDGEGISGVLTEQANAWFFKPNIGKGRFGPVQLVGLKPSIANLNAGQQLMDLAGDGQLDLVQFAGPLSGSYERTFEGGWSNFAPFPSLPNLDWEDPNLKFVDLTGDGHADILITEDEIFTWYPSLAEEGFGPGERTGQSFDEEKGPRLVFADGMQSISLADMSGDGLGDLVRIRNGEICYWPNLGYGRFGAKVSMDATPWFDTPDQFDQRRIRLADIDGSGVTDIIYLNRDGIDLYFNHSGNSWSKARRLDVFPNTDNLSSITVVDLLGNGTACLVWSSPLPGHARQPMRYVKLMEQKPHLLIVTINNMGAETYVQYVSSTKFYLADKAAGKAWITRLPFPVHVVERVETLDRISRNRFVTRYAYHHGYFNGIEREFRGFGMVEQFDTEEFATLSASDTLPEASNIDEASHVPPVVTKTWFHTGAYFERGRISKQFEHEYYREGDPSLGEGSLTDEQLEAMLLPDTVLPETLSIEEEREGCRALKGSILRQEIFARDGGEEEDRPYSVSERNYSIRLLQPRDVNQHSVFLTHASETIDFHYERKLYDITGQKHADPRVTHNVVLEVDEFGNVLKQVAIGYGRRFDVPDPVFTEADRAKQKQTLLTLTENRYTNGVQDFDDYRTSLLCESRTYELVKVAPDANQSGITNLFRFPELADKVAAASDGQHDLPYEDIKGISATAASPYRRLIERVRTLYRRNDLTGPLALAELQSLALPFESYKLAFTPSLLQQVYGNRVTQAMLMEGGYVHTEADADWWIPSVRIFLSPNAADAPASELNNGRQHFFQPRRFVDPFGSATTVSYDACDLLLTETRDALGNTARSQNDHRVMQPRVITDPNGNRSEVAFDAMGLIVGTATMGKAGENLGDSLAGFEPDLDVATITAHLEDPFASPNDILRRASTRLVYDLNRYQRTSATANPQPNVVSTLARETHDADLGPGEQTKIQHSSSYSDGFGREVQKKIQAEPGPLIEGGSVVNPRWVGGGWAIFNNKGKPVRQYEPFFSATHQFEFAKAVGVSPILFYDPVERVVATLQPNHTYEKVVFDPWRQITWDVNDTVTLDPNTDEDVKGFLLRADGTHRLPAKEYLPTWHALRANPVHGAEANLRWPDPRIRDAEKSAADKAKVHEKTPTISNFETLGRPFLTITHNRFNREKPDGTIDTVDEKYPTRAYLDIEGNQREVRDAIEQNGDKLGRMVMRYDYDMLGTRIHEASMEAGERWMLNDVIGKPTHIWDSRNHTFRIEYDALRRPLRSFVIGADPVNPNQELLTERRVYGEQHPQDEFLNLRGKLFIHLDPAGVASNEEHDFKGNARRTSRRLAREYKQAITWTPVEATLPADPVTKLNPVALEAVLAPRLEADTLTTLTSYDALNRPIQLIPRRSDQASTNCNVIQPVYNEANLLERVHVWLDHQAEPTRLLDAATVPPSPVGVNNIDYDAKGQRLRIDYKNGATTRYAYDPETFRISHLYTRRGVAFTEDCDNPMPPPSTIAASDPPPQNMPCGLQNIRYTYDPVGNITHIRDDAQQTIYFAGQVVRPHADYTYDAIYRLIRAASREHIGQVGQPETTWNDEFRVRLPNSTDGQAMRAYTEFYEYDAAGNFQKVIHKAANGDWTRSYTYNEPSLIEPTKNSNRLSNTTVGNGVPEIYPSDGHGNITRMSHLPLMRWDYRDQLQATAQQVINNGTPETTWYVYDADGQRVRKVTELATGQVKDQRIYVDGFEVYRREGANPLVRETLHIMDDKGRIALVETRISGNEPGLPPQLIRYQFGNHLGSASLELDGQSRIISYEEYYPYGSASYQAVRSPTETAKRYRYTGKERDEETGLSYHGARYYAPWLGKWIAADPIGIIDGLNLFEYVLCNPLMLSDQSGMGFWGDVWGGIKGAARGVVEPLVLATDLVRMGGTVIYHEVTGKEEPIEFEFWSGTGKRMANAAEKGDTLGVWRAAAVMATAMPTGGATVLADNIATVFEEDMSPEEAQSFLTQGAVAQVVSTGVAAGGSRRAGEGWTGRGNTKTSVSKMTNKEIDAAINSQGESGPMVELPAKGLQPIESSPYGKAGQIVKIHTQAKTSAPGNTGNVKTTMKIHDADPTAPKGSSSRQQTTMALEQAKGSRRIVPDSTSKWGGRWIHKKSASAQDWGSAHIPLFRDMGGRTPFFPRFIVLPLPIPNRDTPSQPDNLWGITIGGSF
jgi:RHS repeat-associated protein